MGTRKKGSLPLQQTGKAAAGGKSRTAEFSAELLGREFVSLAQKVPAIIFVCVQDRIMFANEKATSDLGYGLEEFYHPRFTFLGIVSPDRRAVIEKHLNECLDNNTDVNAVDLALVAKNGRKVDCLISIKVTLFNHAKATLCVLTDVSALKSTAMALKETGARYQELFTNAPVGIFRTTPSGRMLVANPAIVKMLGYTSFEELARVDVAKYCHPDTPRQAFISCIEQNGEVCGFESKWFRKDGSVIYVRENARAIRDAHARTVYYEGTVEDITEQHTMQTDISRNREFNRLITNIASDLVKLAVDRLDHGVDEALKQLGMFMDVDRGYVFQYSRDGRTFENTHEWVREGVIPHIERLKNIPVRDFWWSNSRLLNNEVVHVPSVEDLPAAAAVEKQEWIREEIKSLVLVPLVCQSAVLGFVGFDSVRTARVWDESTIELFRLLAEIFASAIERRRVSEDLKFRLEFEKLITKISSGVVNVDPSKIVTAIDDSLKALGSFMQADCASVFMLDAASNELVRLHGWCSSCSCAVTERGGRLPAGALPVRGDDSELEGVVRCFDVNEQPAADESYALLRRNGVKSWLSVHFPIDEKKDAFLCLATMKTNVLWPDECVSLFRIIAEIIARALELQKASVSLDQERVLMNALMDNMPDAIYFKDAQSRFLRVNKALAARVKMNIRDVIGRSDFDTHDKDFARQAFEDEQAIIKTGKPIIGKDEQVVRKDGSRVWESVTKLPLFDAGGRIIGTFGISRDITERKRADEENRKIQIQMQHAQKLESLGVMSGGIAHDFNNLLMGILGHTGLALMELKPDSPAWNHMKQAETVALRATELTNQMLAYSGKSTFVIKPVQPSKLVRELADLLAVSISKKVELVFDCPDNLPVVDADPAQIRQVVMNLITNASDAIGDRKGTITLRTGLITLGEDDIKNCFLNETIRAGGFVFIDVVDTGCGMSSEVKERIFDPFFTTKVKGRGLGLAAVLGIVRGHGGTIRVQSEVGKGTEFRVLLPSSGRMPMAEVIEKKVVVPFRGDGSVLIVDDDEVVRLVTEQILKKMGFKPLVADDLAGATARCRAEKDLKVVLLDVSLCEAGVDKALAGIRAGSSCRVLLISGYNEQTATSGLKSGTYQGFLQKPFSAEQLAAKLQQILT